MKTLEDAIVFATRAHEGQLDKSGIPYILHPLRVMNAIYTKYQDQELAQIAVLHDVIEDCGIKKEDLLAEGFSARVSYGVQILSRGDESYNEFIDRVLQNSDVVRVKLEDIHDNKTRPCTDQVFKAKITKKYDKALKKIAVAYPVLH